MSARDFIDAASDSTNNQTLALLAIAEAILETSHPVPPTLPTGSGAATPAPASSVPAGGAGGETITDASQLAGEGEVRIVWDTTYWGGGTRVSIGSLGCDVADLLADGATITRLSKGGAA